MTGRPLAVAHLVQHVLDMPAEVAQGAGADQATTALQGVEHAADRQHPLHVFRLQAPGRQQFVEVADFLVEFLQEDLADLVVDLVAGVVEAGGQRGRGGLHRDHFGFGRGDFALGLDRRSGCLDLGDGVFDRRLRGFRFAAFRDRPVAQQFQAAAGLVEQVLALAERIAQRFQVVLHAGQRIGQGVQLAPAGHLLLADQFGLAVTPQRFQVTGRFRQLQHAHCAADFAQQPRHALQRRMVPVGFDEGDEGVAHAGEIGGGFAREHAHDLARFLREQVVAGIGIALAQARDLVVQRVVDVDQRAGHFQQTGFARGPGAADPVQRISLLLQLGRVVEAGAQVQVERVLDPQQVFLQRRGHGVQQGAVAPGQAAARMFDLRLGRFFKQLRQRILAQRAFAARRAQLVEQRQQHDRNVAVPALQAFQVVGQQHHAAHQRRAGLVAVGGGAALERARQLLHFAGDHRRRMQLQHAQGALHLVQVAGAGAHAFAVFRRLGEGLDLEPRLAQGLVDLGLHPAERGVVDGIPQRRGHRDAPSRPRMPAGRSFLVLLFIRTSTTAIRPAT